MRKVLMGRKVRLIRKPRSTGSLVFSDLLSDCALSNAHNKERLVRGSGIRCSVRCTTGAPHHRDIVVRMLSRMEPCSLAEVVASSSVMSAIVHRALRDREPAAHDVDCLF